MEGSSSTSPFSATNSLTQLPEYRTRSQTHVACNQSSGSWICQSKLGADALNTLDKINKVLADAHDNIREGRLFTQTRFGSSLVQLRGEVVNAAADNVMAKYEIDFESLEKGVCDITKSVREIAKNLSSLDEEKKKSLSMKFEGLCGMVEKLRDRVMAEKRELESNPLKQDPRCELRNIAPFDKKGLEHPDYLKQIQEWKVEEGKELECWKLEGRLTAIKREEWKVAYLENSLVATESCLRSLAANANEESFKKSASASKMEDTGARVFLSMNGGMPFPIPSSLLSSILGSDSDNDSSSNRSEPEGDMSSFPFLFSSMSGNRSSSTSPFSDLRTQILTALLEAKLAGMMKETDKDSKSDKKDDKRDDRKDGNDKSVAP